MSRRRGAKARAGQAAAPARTGPGAAPAPLRTPWLLAGPVALLFAFVSARGAPLGTPVADDYAFLARLAFERPLDWFGSMGAAFYWRPIARQLYFSVFGPSMFQAPWVTVTVHAALFLVLFGLVYDLARRVFPAGVAATIAAFPLLSETTRMLLGWPSAAQHLLAMLFCVLAVREALARRAWTAGAAVVAALWCHEAAGVVLPFVLFLIVRGRAAGRARWLAAAPVLACFALWAVGFLVARAHGVILPPKSMQGVHPGGFLRLARLSVPAILDLEDVPAGVGTAIALGYVALAVWAAVVLAGARGRRRLRAARPALLLGLAWFVASVLPLLAVLDDWNAWRTPLPGLGFGLLAVGFLGAAEPGLALAFTGLRVVALLCAPAAPATVAPMQPVTTSEMSFTRLVRLQRIGDGARRALLARYPTLPPHADVRFQTLPRMAEVGLQGPLALRVWYGDSTLSWRPFGREAGFNEGVRHVIAFDTKKRWQPVVIESTAVSLVGRALAAMDAKQPALAESLFLAAQRAQPAHSDEFEGTVVANRARIAFNAGNVALADSLNRRFREDVGAVADYYALEAAIELARGRPDLAQRSTATALTLEPGNQTAQAVQGLLTGAPPSPR